MTVKLTKEEILTALKEGRVSYHPIGEGYLSPFEAREHLLKIADKLDELPDVDLSIAFDEKDTQKQQKITTHKSNVKTISNQNQHQ